jgi:hypothetical protein
VVPTSDIIRHALATIRERGWTYQYSAGPGKPLNIRSAVSLACTKLCEENQWHKTYIAAIKSISELTDDGVLSYWEFGAPTSKKPRRKQAEVERLLVQAIERWEKHESQVGHGDRPGRSGSDRRTV